jgi:hypothetical protein
MLLPQSRLRQQDQQRQYNRMLNNAAGLMSTSPPSSPGLPSLGALLASGAGTGASASPPTNAASVDLSALLRSIRDCNTAAKGANTTSDNLSVGSGCGSTASLLSVFQQQQQQEQQQQRQQLAANYLKMALGQTPRTTPSPSTSPNTLPSSFPFPSPHDSPNSQQQQAVLQYALLWQNQQQQQQQQRLPDIATLLAQVRAASPAAGGLPGTNMQQHLQQEMQLLQQQQQFSLLQHQQELYAANPLMNLSPRSTTMANLLGSTSLHGPSSAAAALGSSNHGSGAAAASGRRDRVKKACKLDGCKTLARVGGYCIKHGGGKRCVAAQCAKLARFQGSLCKEHKLLLSGTTGAITPPEAVAELAGPAPNSPAAVDDDAAERPQDGQQPDQEILAGATVADVLAATFAPATSATVGAKRKSTPNARSDDESPTKRQNVK